MTTPLNEALEKRHRPAHGRRSAQTHAAFLLPHLKPGMALLDIGCGPGSITVGLAQAVSPGRTCAIDLDPGLEGVNVQRGDAYELPYEDGTFDAIFSCATLQHLTDPLAALREARRVARPGAVIAVADADWGGYLLAPPDPLLDKGFGVMAKMHGGSPNVGRDLRGLLSDAGFARGQVQARAVHHGDAGEARDFASFNASWFTTPAIADLVQARGWATPAEMTTMSEAWLRWGDLAGAFFAGFWCEALAWVD